MTWLTALIALIAIVFFAIAYPGFRKFLLVLFVGLVGAGVAIYLYFQNDLRQREKRELQARSLIRSSEVEFQNLIMSDSWILESQRPRKEQFSISD